MAEEGHHANRVFHDQQGNFNLNGAEFRNDADVDIADVLEALGDITAIGNELTFGTMFRIPTATVGAAGSIQGDAAAVATGFSVVTGAVGTKAVGLPAAAAGHLLLLKNDENAQVLPVVPASGDQINDGAADAALSMAADSSAVFVALGATRWFTVPATPS